MMKVVINKKKVEKYSISSTVSYGTILICDFEEFKGEKKFW